MAILPARRARTMGDFETIILLSMNLEKLAIEIQYNFQ